VTAWLIELAHPSHDISLTSNSISRARSEPEAQMRRLAFLEMAACLIEWTGTASSPQRRWN
jgi:hypothetical protein